MFEPTIGQRVLTELGTGVLQKIDPSLGQWRYIVELPSSITIHFSCHELRPALPETVSVILVIKAGVLEVSKVFADESEADQFYEAMQLEYDIDPLNPDTCAEDVLHLREEVK